MYVLVFTICKPFGRRSHYHHWRVCVLHAVCIAPGAEAKRLLQGIQIREGPLSSILVCVCVCALVHDFAKSKMKTERKMQKIY